MSGSAFYTLHSIMSSPIPRVGTCHSIFLPLIFMAAFTPLREPQWISLNNPSTEETCVYVVGFLMATGAKFN